MQINIRNEIACELNVPTAELDDSLSFTALGGHSLSALRLVSTCRRIGLDLALGELLQDIPIKDIISRSTGIYDTAGGLPVPEDTDPSHSDVSFKVNITPSPSPSGPSTRCSTPDTLVTTGSQDAAKVSIPEMQLSLIQSTLANPGNNILAYHHMCSLADLPAMRAAWQQVLEAEPIFRTEFRIEHDRGYLVDTGVTPYRWREVQVPNWEALQVERGKRPSFDNVAFEFQVITIAGDASVACILWHVHHAFIDGFSMQLVMRKVSRAVAGYPVGAGPSFAAIARERDQMVKGRESDARQYWETKREVLEAAASEIRMPRCHVARRSREFWNKVATFMIDVAQSDLLAYAARHHVTVPSVYYAAWALVLSIICDSNLVLLGVVMSGRSLPVPGILNVIGSLVNTLPMGVEVSLGMDTNGFINGVFRQLLQLSAFDWSPPEHGYRRRFSSVLAMQFDIGGHAGTTNEPSSRMNSEIPISITVEDTQAIHLQFAPEYQETQIQLIGTLFARAISCLMRTNYTISMCLEDMLLVSDRQTLLNYGNCLSGLTTETSVHDDLVVLMKAAAAENPEFCAAHQRAQSMSYQELDSWSDCVAIHLSMYISKGDVVCVHARPCMHWLVAIYGILKVGGVYCPLNSKLDPELRNSMFQSSGATAYLTPSAGETKYRPRASRYVWAVEDLLQRQDDNVQDEFEYIPCPEGNAYLCFTSGSTGKPKGVLCAHRGLVAFQRDLEVRLHAQPGRRIAQTMSVSFDGSIHEIFSALGYGATLVLPTPEDPFSHLSDVDSCIFTPSLAATLNPRDYPNLRYVYLVGEQVTQDTNDRWAASAVLYNMYGPTEATCGATIKRLLPGHKVTIGRPNPTTRIYILDRNGRLAPPGVMGQIYLAGIQVSNGYIGQSDLTSERFFPDSIRRGLGERMYATGDTGYWDGDGDLVCLGRNDRQTKLRGFRLDLDDLEVRITKLPGVARAAVARRGDDLVALVQPVTVCAAECRKYMAAVLPTHAIPRYIIPVEQFPMTPVGKLDYRAIAQTADVRHSPSPSTEMSPTEHRVAGIWADILSVDKAKISPDSNFTAAGGHSLLQLRLAGRLNKAFNCSVPMTDIVKAATLRDLSQEIDKLQKQECRKAQRLPPDMGEGSISRMEREWISKYECCTSNASFTVSFACRLDTAVDLARLKQSWDSVLEAHQILRSRYRVCAGRHRRVFSGHAPVAQRVNEYSVLEEINRPFDIANDDLIRVTISPDTLLVTMSHIICDLTTMQLLLCDVERIYNGAEVLGHRPVYMAADAWHRVAADADLAFWASYLKDSPLSKTKRESYAGTSRVSMVPRETALALEDFLRTSHFSHHQLALAAVALALQANHDSIDSVIGGPFLNRWSEPDMSTIGLFLEPLPFRIQFDPKSVPYADAHGFLQSVKCSSQAAISHAIPWQELVCHLGVTPEFPNHPLFETMVTFHTKSGGLSLRVDGVEPLYTWSEGAKFGLMCEFTTLSDGDICLRLEYDEGIYAPHNICNIEHRILTALGLLIRNAPWPEVTGQLCEVDGEETSVAPRHEGSLFLPPLKRT
ncbi:nonribosomal peptide synthetase gliP [Aspergillus lucknowensis]|uniref:Carrier domain-containing protein n=1 Tax=Aspergillus lucknowensis TaxID=176173 RepID=A0ABR4LYL6_9EURO